MSTQVTPNAASNDLCWTIAKWCIGLAIFAFFGLPVLVIVLLTTIAAIGAMAASDLEARAETSLSAPFEPTAPASDDAPLAGLKNDD